MTRQQLCNSIQYLKLRQGMYMEKSGQIKFCHEDRLAKILAHDTEQQQRIEELTKRAEIAEDCIKLLSHKSWIKPDKIMHDYLFLYYGSYCYKVEDEYIPVNQTAINQALFYAIAEAEYEQKAEGGGDA